MILSSCSVGFYTDTPHATTVVNLSMQPTWGPAGYNYAPYYYFPEFDFYYDVNKAIFYYLNRGRWIAAKHLPPHYPKDLHRYYKVVLTQHNPWLHNSSHRSMYRKYKGVYNQPIIGDKHKPHQPQAPKPAPTPPSSNRYDHNKPAQNKQPQNNGQNGGGSYYGSRGNQSAGGNQSGDNRNVIRDSRNTNTQRGTSYNNGGQRGASSSNPNNGYNRPGNSQSQSSGKVAAGNGSRGTEKSRSQQTTSSRSSSEKKSSTSSSQRGSSQSQGSRSAGSRGR